MSKRKAENQKPGRPAKQLSLAGPATSKQPKKAFELGEKITNHKSRDSFYEERTCSNSNVAFEARVLMAYDYRPDVDITVASYKGRA